MLQCLWFFVHIGLLPYLATPHKVNRADFFTPSSLCKFRSEEVQEGEEEEEASEAVTGAKKVWCSLVFNAEISVAVCML